ncbi:MAG: N-6 DNA methylase [Candidatus Tectomicrobia bacterium]|uniref:site-specific DNA-methyltransferase (adenine-specific) n=1 Tax=Tectimicrobiota bacterium TaxID=2528274 RepID=A0A932MQ87_UNCTE|nr:N-6 DNA methylase [Candidatus Tectomicrobia bacterium]
MDAAEAYFRDLREIRRTGAGVAELSYYGPLRNLLNEIGKSLKPRVNCVMPLADQGAGMPDGGLFTRDQFQRGRGEPLPGQIPARGVIEVKSTKEDAWVTASGKQVSRYWKKYRQVLVTNYRDFVLIGQDQEGRPAKLESLRLAGSEAEFWGTASRTIAQKEGERLTEYLKRAMLHAAALADPQDLAYFLASYAKEAKARIEGSDLPALGAVREALEQALGLKFEGEKGDRFFRSTFIQTLFYGVFSAWVLWAKTHPPGSKERFHWREAAWSLKVPMIRALFEQLATPTRLGPLGLEEVLNWTGAALDRVDRASFFQRFEEGHAVQYFYEPFLAAFDPELRKELGVWYTPPEIVRYMVERVDAVLRAELDIPDGLADRRVYVLDPCAGTGSYLVEALRRIADTLREKGGDALLGEDVKRAAMERVFGFEILPAPFVVSHLQLGLLLQNLGAPLGDTERAGVFLTNALTGWEPPEEPKTKFLFPELEAEHDAAGKVKREVPILVILGNPPYNSFAGVAVGEERDLSTAYRTTQRAPAPQGQGLNDLYVRFFRMAERKIVDRTGKGIVCLISNYSWLDGLSFPGMRERYLDAFDHIWIDCLNGDKYKTGKLTPEGEPDPSVFSTEFNREGIQVGTAIALLVREGKPRKTGEVRFRHLWGKNKRARLVETAAQDGKSLYQTATSPAELGFPFMPVRAQSAYFGWPLLPEVFPVSFPGVKTSRDNVVVDIDRERLARRMEQYFDPTISHEEMRRIAPGVMAATARFKPEAIRDRLLKRGFLPNNIVRCCYRPMDVRWLYWEPETKLLDEKRSEYFPHVREGNIWMSAGQRNRKEAFYQPQVTTLLTDHHIVESNVSMFPLFLFDPIFAGDKSGGQKANLSREAENYLLKIGGTERDLFFHAIAVLHAPAYSSENVSALRQDWPRVPLPASKETLLASAELGRKVAALLDTESPVPGVTAGKLRPEMRSIAVVSGFGGKKLSAADLAVTAGWGHAGKGGVTMPGRGKVMARPYEPREREAIAEGAEVLGLTPKEALKGLGADTRDIYLNDTAYWKNIPERVWDYHIGGYQVIKKWLSYRERDLFGRALTADEAREVTDMARRIAGILLLEPALDANYQAIKGAAFVWGNGSLVCSPNLSPP